MSYVLLLAETNATEKQQSTPLAECQYGGKTYKEGQAIYPKDAPCKKCICQPGFNGEFTYHLITNFLTNKKFHSYTSAYIHHILLII